MESIPPRVGKLENEVHLHAHRITQLESLPIRVGDLERAFDIMNTHFAHIQATNSEIKDGIRDLNEHQKTASGEITGFIRAVKIIGGLVSLAGIGTAIVLWLQ